jgi:hypothetical protein
VNLLFPACRTPRYCIQWQMAAFADKRSRY